jgi:tRNA(Ile)-lysidine synthase
MTPLQKRVLGALTRESLIPADGRVLVALSGGADSVALTLLLRDLAPVLPFALVGVVHLNHQLREAAAEDEQFCRTLADRLGRRISVRSADVNGTAKREGISIEEAGHRERHAFFTWAVDELGADRVATAHTRDDQAETYLMRLLRGAGPVGLSGIHPRSGCVIRPLLDVTKSDLREYLVSRDQPFREDETNYDLSVTRNRVRHELIPFLEQRFSPSIVATLGRDAEIARHDAEWLEAAAHVASASLVTEQDGVVVLDREGLTGQPVSLAGRIAKHALERVTGLCAGFDQVERLLALARSDQPRSDIDLPGCRVTSTGGRIAIAPPRLRQVTRAPGSGFSYRLEVPGEVEIPEAGVAVAVERVGGRMQTAGLRAGARSVYVDENRLSGRLVVRSWRPGDAFRPLGLDGRKKVQDLFVDRKVDRQLRHIVPIVADKQAGIVWVVGHTVADDFRITAATEGMLLLTTRELVVI